MRTPTVIRSRSLRGLVAVLAGSVLVLAGCGSDTGPGPAATTSTPATTPAPTTTSSTTSSTTSTTSTTTSSSTSDPSGTSTAGATPAEAVEAWLRSEGYEYSGDCADAELDRDSGKWCSSLSRDEGEEQTYKVGRVFSQYDYSLKLEKSGGAWSVVDVEDILVGP